MNLRFILSLLLSTSFLTFANSGFLAADGNSDSTVTLTEIQTYWNTTLSSLSETERKEHTAWQQAEHVWKSGESYSSAPSLSSPYCFLPVSGTPQATLSNRYAKSFEAIEVLSPTSAQNTATAEYRPFNGNNWFDLDVSFDANSNTFKFITPYIPSSWMARSSRKIEIRVTIDGVLHECGDLELKPVSRSNLNFVSYFDQIDDSISNFASSQNIDLDSVLTRIKAKQPVSDIENLFGAAKLSSEYTQSILNKLKNGGLSGGQAIYEANEELLLLYLSEADREALLRTATNGEFSTSSPSKNLTKNSTKSNIATQFGCAKITDRINLQLASIERNRLDNKKDISEEIKELTGLNDPVDQASTKLGEMIDKGVEGLEDGLSGTGKLFTFAFSSAYELYQFKELWNQKQLPSKIVKFDYEVVDQEVKARGYLYEDSPSGTACKWVGLKVFAHAEAEGFDTAEFIKGKIPSASDAIPSGVSDVPIMGDIVTELVDSGQKEALDTAHNALKPDLMIEPCRWPESSNDKGIEIEHEENWTMESISGSSIKAASPTSNSFIAADIGKGPLRIKLVVDTRRLALQPFAGHFSYEVKPIEVKFNPISYVVDDVDDAKTLTVSLDNSYEIENASWYFADKNGNWLDSLKEEDGTVTLDVLSGHMTTSGTKEHTLTINPPDDLELYPLTVEVVSEAKGCLRATQGSFRYGQAKIHYQAKAFIVTPNRTCLAQNTSHTLTAHPAPGIQDLDVEWEVTTGNASIIKTSDTTAVLTIGGDPAADIEVKATGNDTFEAHAYFSSGPCFDSVTLTNQYPSELHISGTTGDVFVSDNLSLLAFGELDGFSSSANSTPTLGSGAVAPDLDWIIAFGGSRATVSDQGIKETANPTEGIDATTFYLELDQEGYFWKFLDYNDPKLVASEYSEQPGGTYITEYLELDSDELFGEPVFPVKMTLDPSGSEVVATIEYSIDSAFLQNGSNVNTFWTVFGGSKIDEETNLTEEYYKLTARFPVTETNPTIQLRQTGTVIASDGKPYSLDFSSLTEHKVIRTKGETNYTYSRDDQDGRSCGNWNGRLNLSFDYILDGCCGTISLFQNPLHEGSARQSFISSFNNFSNSEAPEFEGAYSIANFTTDVSLPYCSELKRLKEDNPDPPVPPHRPPTEQDDPEEIEPPEELENDFKTTTPSSSDNPSFPAPNYPSVTSSGSSFGAIPDLNNDVKYPVVLYNFLNPTNLNENGIELATFNTLSGTFVTKTNYISNTALQYLANESWHIVANGQLSDQTTDGLLIERRHNDVQYIDFWERDSSDNSVVANTLLSGKTDFRPIAFGDFNNDGKNDIAGYDTTVLFGAGPLLIFTGSDNGFSSSPTSYFANVANDSLISAAKLQNSNNSFVATSETNNGNAKVILVDDKGMILSTNVLSGVAGSSIRAFADFNSDNIPDLIIHENLSTAFTIHFMNADATVSSTQAYTIPANHILPGLPLF